MAEEDFERFVSAWFEERNIYQDEDDFVAAYLESKYDSIQIDEPIIEGELDGVHYRISWLGGAPMLICLKSPYRIRANLCSPCCPGACDGGSPNPDGYEGYGVPADWMRDQDAEKNQPGREEV